MIMGIATAGITYYNEPLLTYNQRPEKFINTVLIIQPAVTFLLMLLIGAMSDKFGRRKVTSGCILVTEAALIIYVLAINYFPNAILSGICWSKLSAVGTYFYGFGDTMHHLIYMLCSQTSSLF